MDFRAKWYDPALVKFLGVDPLAEKMAGWGMYRYAFNNPISLTDATGMMPDGWSEGNMQLALMFGVFGNGAGNKVGNDL